MWDWIQTNPTLTVAAITAAAAVTGWCYSVHYTLKDISKTLKGQHKLAEKVADHEVRISVLEEAA